MRGGMPCEMMMSVTILIVFGKRHRDLPPRTVDARRYDPENIIFFPGSLYPSPTVQVWSTSIQVVLGAYQKHTPE